MPVVGLSRLPAAAVQDQLDQLFYQWEAYDLDLAEIHRQVSQRGRVSLHLGGRVFNLELQPSDVRAPGFKSILQTARGPVEEPRRPVATYRGHVAGDPQSSVRLLVRPGLFEGYIRTRDSWVFIQPLSQYTRTRRSSGVLVFDDTNVRSEARWKCGVRAIVSQFEELRSDAGELIESVTAESWSNPIRQAEIAVESDYDYYQIHTYNTESHIESLFNQVNGIYESELSLNFSISFRQIWTTQDPYNTAGNLSNLHDAFTKRWNDSMGHVQRDVAFLLSGKNMGGGLSYYSICYTSPAYVVTALSETTARMNENELKLVAHELGHTFDAVHDDYANPSLCGGNGPLMCGRIQENGTKTFSSASKTQIANYLNRSGSCLRRLEYTLFTSQTPASYLDAAPGYEVGTVFSSSGAGVITGLRFYKALGETGSHTLRLWTDSGAPLASVTLPTETASGWQEISLPSPYRISAGINYRATVNTNSWQSKTYCGISPPITNGPLTAQAGYWGTPTGAFPQNWSCSNFFVDILFRRD